MGKYGDAAIIATETLQSGKHNSPREAWNSAVSQVFPTKSSQDKGCPRGAFLGLCETGLIKGVPAGEYCKSIKNKEYAIAALDILKANPRATHTEQELWELVMKGVNKRSNHQMDVVLSLYENGMIK